MNPLLKLLKIQTSKSNLRVQQKDQAEATIYLYDAIGAYWGIGAKQFVDELNAITVPKIHLRINSPGGDVFEARAMSTAIRAHSAKVIAHVDGVAASCASWIALACAEVEIAQGAFFMVHNSWTWTIGNKADHEAAIKLLAKIDNSIARDYQEKTGKDTQQVQQWMDEETWFTADEALAAGFADRIADGEKAADLAWDIAAAYPKAPAALKSSNPPNPAAAPGGNAETQHDFECEHRERRARALVGIA
ncbi:MAG: Clp protease ClpP [Paludibaculum sp.]